jgi:hypothetical protein
MYKSHVIINPTYGPHIPFYYKFTSSCKKYASIDQFPTTAAGEAMSTGCCLISTNPRHDYFALSPDEDYIEVAQESYEDILEATEYLYNNQYDILSIAYKGYHKILRFFDATKNVAYKYKVIKGRSESKT